MTEAGRHELVAILTAIAAHSAPPVRITVHPGKARRQDCASGVASFWK